MFRLWAGAKGFELAEQDLGKKNETGDPSKSASAPPFEEHLEADYPTELDEIGLDLFLEKEHPDFTKGLQTIGADKSLVAQDILLSDWEQQISDEIEAWKHGNKLQRIAVRILPFAPRLSLIFKKLRFRFFLYARGLMVRFKNFCYYLATDGRASVGKAIKSRLSAVGHALSQKLTDFKGLPIKKKLTGILLMLASILTAAFIYQSYKHGFIHGEEELFIPSLAAVAEQNYDFDPETDVEPFYDNLRSTQNLFLFPKMVVNLHRGPQSGANPMVALELFVEGMAPEVIIEMKDREAMIRDAVQRVIEAFSFEQLDTSEGKNNLREKIKGKINTLLIRGTVRRVLIKTIILKP